MGGVRTALFSYLYAKKHGGDFLLRIEDTDQTRYVPGAEEYIIEALTWSGIKIDEGVGVGGPHEPYRQSERKEAGVYKQYAEQMVKDGHAYYAFDTSEELEEMRKRMEAAKMVSAYNAVTRQNMKNSLTLSEDEVKKRLEAGDPYVIRLKVPRNEEIRFQDIIRGWVVVNSSQVDDKVLLKADGMPTYHLAHIVDDYLMEITHAARGEEWLPSAPAHILIYRYLGWEDVMPQYAHLPLLLKPDGNGKLSKRDGDKLGFPVFPIDWKDPVTGKISSGYREKGYFPEAFVNMIALLGWNPGTTQELFTMDELIQSFSFERVNKAGAKFDPNKAKWFNQQYLLKHSNEEIAEMWMPELKGKGVNADKAYVTKVVELIKEKAYFINELSEDQKQRDKQAREEAGGVAAEEPQRGSLWESGYYFFVRPASYDQGVISKRWNEKTSKFIADLKDAYSKLNDFSATETENTLKIVSDSNGLKPGEVMQLYRVCISGVAGGPLIFELTAMLGKDEVVARLSLALEKVKS
jgi:glutamyl-tRNA synthetase